MFAQRLKELRLEKGLSQQELAEKLNISGKTVSGYENNVSQPNLELLVKMARLFNVSVDYILGLSEVKTTDKDLNYICEFTGLSEEAIILLKKYRNHCRITLSLSFLMRSNDEWDISKFTHEFKNKQLNTSEIINDFLLFYFKELNNQFHDYFSLGTIELYNEISVNNLECISTDDKEWNEYCNENIKSVKKAHAFELQSKFGEFIKKEDELNSQKIRKE